MRQRLSTGLLATVLVSVLAATTLTGGTAVADPSDGRPVSLDFRGEATLPAGMQFAGTTLGGLSSIAYDAHDDVYYAGSDDQAGVRYYTLRIDAADGRLEQGDVTVFDVTGLQPPVGDTYQPGTVDPEGLTLTANRTLVITSEGVAAAGIDPWIREYRLDGSYLRDLPVPEQFLPAPGRGVRQNLGFEAAAVAPNGQFLFAANEGALVQDGPAATPSNGSVARILRYRVSTGVVERGYAYPVDAVSAQPVPPGSFSVNGLVELMPLDPQHLIAMERSFSVGVGNSVTLHSVALPGADDILGLDSLAGTDAEPVGKTELLDLDTLGVTLDNLEGLTLGPQLADGRRALVVVSDNNFTPGQPSQFLLLAAR